MKKTTNTTTNTHQHNTSTPPLYLQLDSDATSHSSFTQDSTGDAAKYARELEVEHRKQAAYNRARAEELDSAPMPAAGAIPLAPMPTGVAEEQAQILQNIQDKAAEKNADATANNEAVCPCLNTTLPPSLPPLRFPPSHMTGTPPLLCHGRGCMTC